MELEDYKESARILETIIGITRNTVIIKIKKKEIWVKELLQINKELDKNRWFGGSKEAYEGDEISDYYWN